jgi:hypothetical protein
MHRAHCCQGTGRVAHGPPAAPPRCPGSAAGPQFLPCAFSAYAAHPGGRQSWCWGGWRRERGSIQTPRRRPWRWMPCAVRQAGSWHASSCLVCTRVKRPMPGGRACRSRPAARAGAVSCALVKRTQGPAANHRWLARGSILLHLARPALACHPRDRSRDLTAKTAALSSRGC